LFNNAHPDKLKTKIRIGIIFKTLCSKIILKFNIYKIGRTVKTKITGEIKKQGNLTLLQDK